MSDMIRYTAAIERESGDWETLGGLGPIAVATLVGDLLEGHPIGERSPVAVEVRIGRVLILAVEHPDRRMTERTGKPAPREGALSPSERAASDRAVRSAVVSERQGKLL